MTIETLSPIIITFCLFFIYVGLNLLREPNGLLNMIRDALDEPILQVIASIGRILFGVLLLSYASQANWPWVLNILGYLSLITGLIFLVMPAPYFQAFVSQAIGWMQPVKHLPGILSLSIAVLLLFAVI